MLPAGTWTGWRYRLITGGTGLFVFSSSALLKLMKSAELAAIGLLDRPHDYVKISKRIVDVLLWGFSSDGSYKMRSTCGEK